MPRLSMSRQRSEQKCSKKRDAHVIRMSGGGIANYVLSRPVLLSKNRPRAIICRAVGAGGYSTYTAVKRLYQDSPIGGGVPGRCPGLSYAAPLALEDIPRTPLLNGCIDIHQLAE